MDILDEAITALEAVNGAEYTFDSLSNLVGLNSGSSADYTYEELGIKYSYGVELRDTGDTCLWTSWGSNLTNSNWKFRCLKSYYEQSIGSVSSLNKEEDVQNKNAIKIKEMISARPYLCVYLCESGLIFFFFFDLVPHSRSLFSHFYPKNIDLTFELLFTIYSYE